ncbi:hypothetical protein AOE01nite_11520 [Acetobacter oeni]|uniref:Uncharacterized protein n=1 Tax=Acetobacter oeni TaxID=304077 RepID=A0A511XJ09_9PROT|nr:hypothetical protein AOE01nite_11520 [Acetobacter oeni]
MWLFRYAPTYLHSSMNVLLKRNTRSFNISRNGNVALYHKITIYFDSITHQDKFCFANFYSKLTGTELTPVQTRKRSGLRYGIENSRYNNVIVSIPLCCFYKDMITNLRWRIA